MNAVPNTDFDYLPFAGGLDQVTPSWNVKPGYLREALNYEIGINEGYDRVKGYERFDGSTAPSDAIYGLLYVNITGSFSVGDTVTGASSGATAVVVAVVATAPTYLVVTKINGNFQDETINVSGSPQGTIGTRYDSDSFSLFSDDAIPSGVTFNNDGTALYMAGFQSQSIYQYTLSTAWQLSSVTLSKTLDLSAEGVSPRSVRFNDNLDIMYVLDDGSPDSIRQYSLSVPGDIETAKFTGKTLDLSGQLSASGDFVFNSDYTKVYVVPSDDPLIIQYGLTTAGEVDTGTYESDRSTTIDGSPKALALDPTDTVILLVGEDSVIYQLEFTEKNDITSVVDTSHSFSVISEINGDVYAVEFGDSGNKVFALSQSASPFGTLYRYSAAVPYGLDPRPVIDGALTDLLHAQYKNAAADEYRSDIEAVPGSGGVLGIWMLNDIWYAFRNSVAGNEAHLYKSSSSGWVQVSLGRELSFTSGGTTEISAGDTITGVTSAATAVVTRVSLESGSWAGGDAAGRLIFASQTGTFQAENIDVGASANVATIAGDSSAITLLPNGRYEFITTNFGGEAEKDRIYGCDGVNRGFEFDGTTFAPIATGMSVDTPKFVIEHKKHLFFAFKGSAQHSGIADPFSWSPVLGAAELAVGDTITGFQTETGSESVAALGIYSRNSTHILYGTSASDWNLVKYRKEVGAYAYSIQQLGSTIMMDDRGLKSFYTTERFGNFQHSTLSRLLQPFVNERKNKVQASCLVRDKNQYRLFFNDDWALFVTGSGQKIKGMMPVRMEHKLNCIASLETDSGGERIMFGSDDGFVYEMEKGTSFDGDPIEHYLITHFHHSKSPRVQKSYKSATLEILGDGYASFDFGYELGYNDSSLPQPVTQTKALSLDSARFNQFFWDKFYWDGRAITPSRLGIEGSAENISLVIRGSSDYDESIRVSGAMLRLIYRRQLR